MSVRASPHQHAECVLETELASRLRNASKAERMTLYGKVYDEYHGTFPESMPGSADDPGVSYELKFAQRFITPGSIVAEVGPGRCELALALARFCARLYAIDVADLSRGMAAPANFQHILTDGIHIELPGESVDVVLSNQLMEHLHPDDAADQLAEIHRILRPDGRYICITPNRLIGPHDSSARFEDLPCPVAGNMYVANGFHLKEYTNGELARLLRAAGFRWHQSFIGARGHYVPMPGFAMAALEAGLRQLPLTLRKRSRVGQMLVGVRMVAAK